MDSKMATHKHDNKTRMQSNKQHKQSSKRMHINEQAINKQSPSVHLHAANNLAGF